MRKAMFLAAFLAAILILLSARCTRDEMPTRAARGADSVGVGLRITVEGGGAWADTLEYRP